MSHKGLHALGIVIRFDPQRGTKMAQGVEAVLRFFLLPLFPFGFISIISVKTPVTRPRRPRLSKPSIDNSEHLRDPVHPPPPPRTPPGPTHPSPPFSASPPP